eukprot:scaffold1307_cov200-Pinguiococcus_pyrenoidosus.AAC.91
MDSPASLLRLSPAPRSQILRLGAAPSALSVGEATFAVWGSCQRAASGVERGRPAHHRPPLLRPSCSVCCDS